MDEKVKRFNILIWILTLPPFIGAVILGYLIWNLSLPLWLRVVVVFGPWVVGGIVMVKVHISITKELKKYSLRKEK